MGRKQALKANFYKEMRNAGHLCLYSSHCIHESQQTFPIGPKFALRTLLTKVLQAATTSQSGSVTFCSFSKGK